MTESQPLPPTHIRRHDDVPDATARLERALLEVKRVVVGQDLLVERMFVSLVSGGHCLLEGVPGVAKTLAARTVASVVGGAFSRIQFTPDLVPADIVGTRVYRSSSETFEVEPGPIVGNVVLADEINRAPAKVQSALLEAMAEHQVSVGGRTVRLPDPFMVLATQNPIESEGVYALPEAQRDRFMMKVSVDLPTDEEERRILDRVGVSTPSVQTLLDPHEVAAIQAQAAGVFVHDAVADYAVRIVVATRDPRRPGVEDLASLVSAGASPRATLSLVAGARSLALLRGREYVLPVDVRDLAVDVVAHRLVLDFEALADGVDPRAIVAGLVARIPEPQVAPAQVAPGAA
ncbi:AAA family ATPase [Solicola sp. PLA-1-18]|uniref:AAA family ATPase n=1 Tax=Solicola sp. PLA-1-18 TaxID=3380532 RepID=UPI003B78ECEB